MAYLEFKEGDSGAAEAAAFSLKLTHEFRRFWEQNCANFQRRGGHDRLLQLLVYAAAVYRRDIGLLFWMHVVASCVVMLHRR